MKTFEEYSEALTNQEKDKHFSFAHDKVQQILSKILDKNIVNIHSRGRELQYALDDERKTLAKIWKDEDNRNEALKAFNSSVDNWRSMMEKYLR